MNLSDDKDEELSEDLQPMDDLLSFRTFELKPD